MKQESEYNFPYHYIPQYKYGFTQNYNWEWGKQYASAIEFILDEIKADEKQKMTIADIGCGDGRLTKELSEYFNDKEVLGFDYSSKAINLAKALNPNVKFEQKDIIKDKIQQRFDAITLVEVFEHIPLDLCVEFADALASLLNSGGKMYMTVPHQNKTLSYKHFQHFTYESLVKYFEKNFEVEKVVYIQRHDKLLTFFNILMCNKFWIVNSRFFNNFIYKFYKKRYFIAGEGNCGRIYLKLRKK